MLPCSAIRRTAGCARGSPHYDIDSDCRHEVWVPFLSGYGGITLARFPNGVVYCYVSNGGAHRWARAIRGADKIRPMC